jgi:hypothetical protein
MIMADNCWAENETRKHIAEVQKNITKVIHELLDRQFFHDVSKLESPEKEIFDEYTAKLANTTYGSEEYKNYLKGMKPALDHHYKENRHHPEHFENGIKEMTLVDLIELLADWVGACKRHQDGNIMNSVIINQKRFGYGDEIKQLLINTIESKIFDDK